MGAIDNGFMPENTVLNYAHVETMYPVQESKSVELNKEAPAGYQFVLDPISGATILKPINPTTPSDKQKDDNSFNDQSLELMIV